MISGEGLWIQRQQELEAQALRGVDFDNLRLAMDGIFLISSSEGKDELGEALLPIVMRQVDIDGGTQELMEVPVSVEMLLTYFEPEEIPRLIVTAHSFSTEPEQRAYLRGQLVERADQQRRLENVSENIVNLRKNVNSHDIGHHMDEAS